MTTSHRNVVFLISDQWRAEATGYSGNEIIKTPVIDGLAAEGAGFTGCFVQHPVSTTSRAALASGRYPHVNGHRTMQHHLRTHEANMLRTFKDNGWHVWWGGKNDMIAQECIELSCDDRVQGGWGGAAKVDSPHEPGTGLFYSFLYGEVPENFGSAHGDKHTVESAADFIRNAPADKPFFMLVNNGYPHPPYAAAEPWFSMYDRDKVPFPKRQETPFEGKPQMSKLLYERMKLNELTDADWREIVAVYYAMCSQVDDNFARVIDALKETGHYDDTLVIISSDHGDWTGDYQLVEKSQNNFEDVLVNVPLAIHAPGCQPIGVTDALVQWIDLMPTALDYAGIEPVETHFGRSLMPLLRGEVEKIRDHVFCEGGALATEVHTHEEGDRPTTQIYWPRTSLQNDYKEAHGKCVMVRSQDFKYVRRMYDTDELYDLKADPDELVNRIDDPALADVKRELESVMLDWFLETGDAVPWRWTLRAPNQEHPEYSAKAVTYGTI